MSAPSEAEVQELARTIAAAGAAEPARVFHLSWWSERMLDWALAHPRFKTQRRLLENTSNEAHSLYIPVGACYS